MPSAAGLMTDESTSAAKQNGLKAALFIPEMAGL